MILAHAARLGHSPWSWHSHPDVWVLVALLGGGYWLALRGRRRRTGEQAASRREGALFGAGLGLLWVMSDWPVHDLAEGHLYSVHMVQHTVLTLVVPPLLLLGTPRWLLRRLVEPVLPVIRQLVRPLLALLLFNGTLALTHWTGLTNAAVSSGWSHLAQHVALVVTATLMWWPVVGRLPELGQMHPAAKMGYLFLQSLVPTVPASFLAIADGPIYRAYERFPKFWGLTATTDQQLAGAIMKLGGGAILWAVMARVFYQWCVRDGGADWPIPRPSQEIAGSSPSGDSSVPARLAVGRYRRALQTATSTDSLPCISEEAARTKGLGPPTVSRLSDE